MSRSFSVLPRLAFRNVRLQKRRSAFIVVILTVGCAGLLLVAGFFEGVLHNLREQFIHGNTGHLMVAKTGYYAHGVANPFKFLLESPQSVSQAWQKHPEIVTVVPRLQFEGLLTTEAKASSVGIIGVDPVAEMRMGQYGEADARTSALRIVEGNDLDDGDPNGIIVGRGVAKVLKLKVSDPVSLLVTTKSGSIDGANFNVRGVFETPIREFDNQFIKINLGSAKSVAQTEDAVSSLIVMLRDTGSTQAVQSQLSGLLGSNYEVLSWEERGDFYRNGRDILRQIYLIILLIFSALIFFSISSSVNMAFFERVREFGTMMALGNPRSLILSLVTLETLIVGVIGVVLGLGLAMLASLLIAQLGFQMPPLPGSTSGYEAKIILTPLLFFKVAGIGLGAAVLSSLFVSLRVYSLRIVNALGYV